MPVKAATISEKSKMMRPKPKTMRHVPSRPVATAMPRRGSSVFLTLNRLVSEWERLKGEETDLQMRLEQKQKQLAALEQQIEHYKEQASVAGQAAPRQSQPAPAAAFVVNTGNQPTWQTLVVEY